MEKIHAKQDLLQKFFVATLIILILTIVHHIYGAVIYETPFRLHITFFAVPVMILLTVSYRIYEKKRSSLPGRIAFLPFMVMAVLVPVGMFGLVEGGYNHLVKNILYFGGADAATLDRLFPPPTYEMPNDFWFEATGIFQFFAAVYGIYLLILLTTGFIRRADN